MCVEVIWTSQRHVVCHVTYSTAHHKTSPVASWDNKVPIGPGIVGNSDNFRLLFYEYYEF